jgi:hypothetical protein
MGEEEKRLLDCFERLRPSNKLLFLAQITFAAEMEEHARRIARGLADSGPLYADRNPAPVGEAVNG